MKIIKLHSSTLELNERCLNVASSPSFTPKSCSICQTIFSMKKEESSMKKKSKELGVTSKQLIEAIEVFGGAGKIMREREKRKRSMHDDEERQLAPNIWEEENLIRLTDIPERIQLHEKNAGAPRFDELCIDEESAWIHKHLAADIHVDKEDIKRFLVFYHVEKLDVPFICMYRKVECMSLLGDQPSLTWHKVLWAVKELDKKWLLLQNKKSRLKSYFADCYDEDLAQQEQETMIHYNKQVYNSITNTLKVADDEREVDDTLFKCKLHLHQAEKGEWKRPKKVSLYDTYKRVGLWEIARQCGYNIGDFGLMESLERCKLEDPGETPDEMAARFTCHLYESVEAVLEGARYMAAIDISHEPSVRKRARYAFMESAVVSTHPTNFEADRLIDSFHQYAGVKWLNDKQINQLENVQWLLIQKAEEQKLLHVSIRLPYPILEKLISEVVHHYYFGGGGVRDTVRQWDNQRTLILQSAFFHHLLPLMESEAREVLSRKAKMWLRQEYGEALWKRVSVCYRLEDADQIFMACCLGPGEPTTATFVILDSFGEVVDSVDARFLSFSGHDPREKKLEKNDQQHLMKFMIKHQPQVVIIGAVNLIGI